MYYLVVVVFEVPSGYISDRLGRKPVLILSAALFMCSYISFIFANGMAALLLGEILLAAAIASQSGSDTSLLYDSLKHLGRDEKYGQREAKAAQYGMIALAFSTHVDGVVGVWDLRLAYVTGVLAAGATFVVACLFTEPAIPDETNQTPQFGGFLSR